MSEYCPYNETSSTYDNARAPIDLDDLVARIETLAQDRGCKVEDLKLLDVGAGTSNYLFGLRARGVMVQYHGVEGSQGMIDRCMEKLKGLKETERGVVNCSLGDLNDGIAYDDNMFDIVITTQVLHHLSNGRAATSGEDRPEANFDLVWKVLQEIQRVCRPGGIFWCQTQTPEQHREGFWWAELTPRASATLASRFAPMDLFTDKVLYIACAYCVFSFACR
jgi:ubiquinone/menaquinone biosynthesis C-methylase UbiE